jgi:hypothetical protein
MPLPGPERTAGTVIEPDPIEPVGWGQIDLMPGERNLRVWRTARGLLVMTNLRCVDLWRRNEIPPTPGGTRAAASSSTT